MAKVKDGYLKYLGSASAISNEFKLILGIQK